MNLTLTETVMFLNENNTYMSRANSLLLLQVLLASYVFGVAVVPGL